MRKPQVYSLALVAAVAVGLAACGDDSSDFSARPEKLPDNAVLSFDDLSNCTAKKAGALEFVKDTPYVCVESGDKFRWEKVSQTEDEPEDFKVCNQGREGQYALSSSENILYVCSDEEWTPLIQINDDASSSSGKEDGSSSSKSKSSDSGKDAKSSSSATSSSGKDAKSSSESSSSVSSSSGKSSSSGGTSSSVSSSSAASSSGTSSSEVRSSSSIPSSFSVGDDRSVYDAKNNTLTDYRDGQVYRTVTIGEQTWMAENLNYAYTDVPYDFGKYTSDSTSWCHEDSVSHCVKYGRLYLWSAAMDSVGTWSANGMGCGYGSKCSPTYPVRGVCPEGWHLPDTTEWRTLFTAVSVQSTSGKVLKSTSGWKDHLGENGNGTDVYAFSALPAGCRYDNGVYDYEGIATLFWNSSQSGNIFFAYTMVLDNGNDCRLMYYSANYAYSVRCLKD